ncbi:MAG: ribulokinase [Verrucomicrobia bacterium]|nr:ribulokinase [Verrucomicrobiota bacterium]
MKSSPSRSGKTKQYVIGVDFGTLSGRALLVDVHTGEEVTSAVYEYADGVIETTLPGDKKRLPPDTALQNPADYLTALSATIPKVLRAAKVKPEQIIGLGTDFTCCTMLPTKADGTPLCFDKKWRKNPHAWVKLWKHHAAQPEANFINEIGHQGNEPFLATYGGKYSSEWFFSKLLETVNHAPEVYDAADRFIEAGDWIVWQLCGAERRCVSAAGFKAMWVYPDGKGGWTYPSPDFFQPLHPKLENVVVEKFSAKLYPLGSRAGGLTAAMAKLTGLREGTPVAVGNIDAHVAVPACTVTTPGKLVMIMGTSTCHLLIGETRQEVEGMCGVVKDGVVPGFWGYEAGQAGVGDLFAWYVGQGVPAYVQAEAKKSGKSVYQILERKAAALKPGESGLLALDWWNGNRSVLVDADLTGLLIGATLTTKPHEIYRALVEATAFGTRKIIEAFTNKGVAIDELYACGGLAQKNPLLMQIYSNVTGRPIKVAESEQTCALGAAMQAAVAAGAYPKIHAAALKMARVRKKSYQPDFRNKPIYDQLYAEYTRLHDWFGRDPHGTMKVLKQLKVRVLSRTEK